MKNLKKIILFGLLLVVFNSCSNDNNPPENKENIENMNSSDYYQDSNSVEDIINPVNYAFNQCLPNTGALCCGLSGYFKVKPGKEYIYSASTAGNNPYITWEVISGSIKIVSVHGNKATVYFNTDFTEGSIEFRSAGSNTSLCSTSLDISKL